MADRLPDRVAAEGRHYDLANLWVVGVLALLCGALWWGLRTPAGEAPEAGTPPSGLEFYAARGWLRLTGMVPDDVSRQRLHSAAAAEFGEDRVIDELALRPGTAALPWLDRAGDVFAGLKGSADSAGLRVGDGRIVLSGSVPHDYMRVAREAQVRDWFGRTMVIDNRLSVAVPSGPVAAASAAASAGLATAVAATGKAPAAAPAAVCGTLGAGVALGFVPGQATLTPAGLQQLVELSPCLSGTGRWRITGHTDANGAEPKNVALTLARAEAVKAALAARGVAAARLEAVGAGSAQPVADNASREGRLRNRRVSFEPL